MANQKKGALGCSLDTLIETNTFGTSISDLLKLNAISTLPKASYVSTFVYDESLCLDTLAHIINPSTTEDDLLQFLDKYRAPSFTCLEELLDAQQTQIYFQQSYNTSLSTQLFEGLADLLDES